MTQSVSTTQFQAGKTTYGFLIVPSKPETNKPDVDPKEATKTEGKLKSAVKDSGEKPSKFKQAIGNLKNYMNDARNNITKEPRQLISKFSGIAVAQTLATGKVTCNSAADYLFLGFAPAIGVTGSALGYSGINQMKDALFNGDINVGAFVNGFDKALKGATDLKDQLLNKQVTQQQNIIEFDLTISHDEQYQSETPDRRVEKGETLSETVHNLPESVSIQCALQEGRRYSTEDFRSMMKEIRRNKTLVSLYLGDIRYDDMILVNFNPNTDCTKSGFDFALEFKKVIIGQIGYTEVVLQDIPKELDYSDSTTLGKSNASFDIKAGLNKAQKDAQDFLTRGDIESLKKSELYKFIEYTEWAKKHPYANPAIPPQNSTPLPRR